MPPASAMTLCKAAAAGLGASARRRRARCAGLSARRCLRPARFGVFGPADPYPFAVGAIAGAGVEQLWLGQGRARLRLLLQSHADDGLVGGGGDLLQQLAEVGAALDARPRGDSPRAESLAGCACRPARRNSARPPGSRRRVWRPSSRRRRGSAVPRRSSSARPCRAAARLPAGSSPENVGCRIDFAVGQARLELEEPVVANESLQFDRRVWSSSRCIGILLCGAVGAGRPADIRYRRHRMFIRAARSCRLACRPA